MGSVKIRLTVPGLPTFSGKTTRILLLFLPGFRVPGFFLPFRKKTSQKISGKPTPPCNLISDLDGKIVNMVIRNGTPLVKTGDICKQGDILVSGEVPILNDSQEVVRVEYVPADADIYVRHQIAYYRRSPFPMKKRFKAALQKPAGIFVLVTSFLAQIQEKNPDI